MNNRFYYVGLDLHKKKIVYCVKKSSGRTVDSGEIESNRHGLRQWAQSMKRPWIGAMEATLFTGWVYDFLKPYAHELQVANPILARAIAASKKKSDRLDAEKLAELSRCDLLPLCYMAEPEIRELRRVLRYRNLLVREATRFKNRTAGLLMELGAEYDKVRLHRKGYFSKLLDSLDEVPDSVVCLLRTSRAHMEIFNAAQRRLVNALSEHPRLGERVRRLMTIAGVGKVTALTWALEVGDPKRFHTVREAVSYCGLCSALRESAGKIKRGPLSKQRNKYLQWVLVEAAKMAPRYNEQLAALYAFQSRRGNKNRATLAVARKLVAYLLAVDKGQRDFQTRTKGGSPTT